MHAGTKVMETPRLTRTTTAIAGPSVWTKPMLASRSVARPAATRSAAVMMIGSTSAVASRAASAGSSPRRMWPRIPERKKTE